MHQQRHSPLSCVARRLLLDKCKRTPLQPPTPLHPTLATSSFYSVMSELDTLAQRLLEGFSSLHVEKFNDKNGEGWLVVSRYVVISF